MKKLVLFIVLMAAVAMASGQRYVEIKLNQDKVLVNNLDLSKIIGTDTSFVFKIMKTVNNCWSIHSAWSGVTGAGSVKIEVTDFDNLTNWIAYTGSLSTTISGTTGTGAWEDSMFAWSYLKITITKGTLSAGRFNQLLNIN